MIIKKILAAALGLLFIAGCGIIKYVPVETNTEVHVKDSTVYHVLDSVRITEATRYRDMAWLGDTLRIDGSRSRMWACADTTKEAVLGGLEEDEVEERFKIVYRDRVEYRDSVQTRDVPVPVEVVRKEIPSWVWWSLGINLILFLIVLVKLLRFFKIG